MSRIFKPRRGSRESAIDKNIILQDGEIYFEKPNNANEYGKIVMGDGTTSYANLPYFLVSDGKNTQIEVTLTLYGAKEDTITIYDSNNELAGSCIFNTNATSGTCTITITPDTEYKFVSNKGKGTTNDTINTNYIKLVVLTDASNQSVNVFPDGTVYWYGYEAVNITSHADIGSGGTVEATKQTNKLFYKCIPLTNEYVHCAAGFTIDSVLNTSSYTKLKVQFSDCSIYSGVPSNGNKPLNIGFGTMNYGSSVEGTSLGSYTSNVSTSTIYEYNIASISSMQYLAIGGHCWTSISSYANGVGISRYWFE